MPHSDWSCRDGAEKGAPEGDRQRRRSASGHHRARERDADDRDDDGNDIDAVDLALTVHSRIVWVDHSWAASQASSNADFSLWSVRAWASSSAIFA